MFLCDYQKMIEAIQGGLIYFFIYAESLRVKIVERCLADRYPDVVFKRAGYTRVDGHHWKNGPYQIKLTEFEGIRYTYQISIVFED